LIGSKAQPEDKSIGGSAVMYEARHKILLVEDNVHAAIGIKRNLNLYGRYEVLYAKNVQQALDYAGQHRTIRMVVTDIMLTDYAPFTSDDVQDGQVAGLLLIWELEKLLPAAKIIAMSTVSDQKITEALKPHRSVIYAGDYLNWREIQRQIDYTLKDERWIPELFIVHGHDDNLLNQLIVFINNSLNFGQAIVLKDVEKRGGTIIEVLEKYVTSADIVFVLLSEDDSGYGSAEGHRARQNVVFEAGFCMGMKRRQSGRVVMLCKGKPEIWSDIHGLYLIDVTQGIAAAGEEIRREVKWLLES
jgi:CheY-like chemotaxis protein